MTFSVLMPYRPGDDRREQSAKWVTKRILGLYPDCELILADSLDEPFNRGASLNWAASRATRDILLIMDADTFTNIVYLEEALGALESAPWAYPYGRYFNLSDEKSLEILGCDPATGEFDRPQPEEVEHDLESTSGIFLIPRVGFEEMGGFDERFIGWGGEDVAFFQAAKAILGNPYRVDGWVGHLWHPAREEDRFGSPNWPHNAKLEERYRRMGNFPQDMKQYIQERPTRVEG